MTHDELPGDLRAALDALDARADAAAERLDVARVEARVLERLRTEPVAAAPPPRRLTPLLRLAAALVLLVAGGVTAGRLIGKQKPLATAALPLTTIEAFDSAQTRAALAVVERFDRSDTLAVIRTTVTVDDLDETELRALLQALETEDLSL